MLLTWVLYYLLLSFSESNESSKQASGIIRYETIHFADTYIIQKDSTASSIDKAKVDLIAELTRRERRDTAILYFMPRAHFLHVKTELPGPAGQASKYADILLRETPQGCTYAFKNPGLKPKFLPNCPVDSHLSFVATDSLREIVGIPCRAWKSEELPNHYFWVATSFKRQIGPEPRRYINLLGLILGIENGRLQTLAYKIDFCKINEKELLNRPLLELKEVDLR